MEYLLLFIVFVMVVVALSKIADLTTRVRWLEEHIATNSKIGEITAEEREKTAAPQYRPEPVYRPQPLAASETLRTVLPPKPPKISPEPSPSPAPASAGFTPGALNFEQIVGGKLLLWVGSITLFLAGVFLVNYGIDRGILTPQIRMAAAAAMGMIIYAISWRLDREKLTNIPDMLAAIGVSVLFAVILGCRYYYHWLNMESALALLTTSNALLLIRGWFKTEAFSYIGILLGYATPALVQPAPFDCMLVSCYLMLLTITFCILGWQKKQTRYLDIAIVFQSIWTAGMLIVEDVNIRGYNTLLPAFLMAIAAAWIGYEKMKVENDNRKTSVFDCLAALALIGIAFFSLYKGFGREFWISEGLVMLWLVISNRLHPRHRLLLAAECAVFVFGVLISQLNSGAYNLYTAGILLLCAILQIRPVPQDDENSIPTYSALFPIIGASMLLWHARTAPVGKPLPIIDLAAGQALCLAIAWFHTISAHRNDWRKSFEISSGALCMTIGLCIATLAPQYWWSVGLGFSALITVAIYEWFHRESDVYFNQVIGLTLSILAIGTALAIRDLTGDRHGKILLIIAPTVWMGLPILPLAVAHKRFERSPLYMAYKDRALASLKLLGLCTVFWQTHTLLSIGLRSADSASGAYHAGGLLSISLAYVWMLNRTRHDEDDRSLQTQIFTGLYLVGVIAAILIGAFLYNPWFNPISLGATRIFNALWLIYGIPWALIALMSRRLPSTISNEMTSPVKTISLFAELILVVALVRQWFHGSSFYGAGAGTSELVCISAAMAIYGLALLWSGIVRRSMMLRLSSLFILLLTAVKLFLWDLSSLSGIARFASFFGLGIALMTIGYIYQKTNLGGEKE